MLLAAAIDAFLCVCFNATTQFYAMSMGLRLMLREF
jgi:hypothetical protein